MEIRLLILISTFITLLCGCSGKQLKYDEQPINIVERHKYTVIKDELNVDYSYAFTDGSIPFNCDSLFGGKRERNAISSNRYNHPFTIAIELLPSDTITILIYSTTPQINRSETFIYLGKVNIKPVAQNEKVEIDIEDIQKVMKKDFSALVVLKNSKPSSKCLMNSWP